MGLKINDVKIITKHLELVPCDIRILRAAIAGDSVLAELLDIKIIPGWTIFGLEPLEYVMQRLNSSRHEVGWWTYFPIHTAESALIGCGGYKGPPNAAGEIEIGYEIAASYQGKGYATEMSMALVEHAFKAEEVSRIFAHTLGYKNASGSVLKKCGFKQVGEIEDPDLGRIWKWQVNKS